MFPVTPSRAFLIRKTLSEHLIFKIVTLFANRPPFQTQGEHFNLMNPLLLHVPWQIGDLFLSIISTYCPDLLRVTIPQSREQWVLQTFFFPEAEEITKTGQITLPNMSMSRRVCDISRNCPIRRRHSQGSSRAVSGRAAITLLNPFFGIYILERKPLASCSFTARFLHSNFKSPFLLFQLSIFALSFDFSSFFSPSFSISLSVSDSCLSLLLFRFSFLWF